MAVSVVNHNSSDVQIVVEDNRGTAVSVCAGYHTLGALLPAIVVVAATTTTTTGNLCLIISRPSSLTGYSSSS